MKLFAIILLIMLFAAVPLQSSFAQEQEEPQPSYMQEEKSVPPKDTIRRPETLNLAQSPIDFNIPTEVPSISGIPLPRMDLILSEGLTIDEGRAE